MRGLQMAMVLALMAPAPTGAQPIQSIQVRPGIHMLTGKGGNLGLLVGGDGTFLIDDKFAPLTEAILAEIRRLGGETPRFVLNTHYHADHTGGNENLGRAGSVIVAHANVRRRLAEGTRIPATGRVVPPLSDVALPIVTFDRDVGFHLNGQTVEVKHLPAAHTDGDAVVRFREANVIHAGDAFFNGFFPFVDTGHGGTLKGAIAAADAMLAMSDAETRIIPGHGPLGSRAELRAYRDMLATARERLVRLKAAGRSAAEAVAEAPLADLEPEWGDGIFDAARWIRIVYDGL